MNDSQVLPDLLFRAVEASDLAEVHRLLAAGADPNAIEPTGRSPLMEAKNVEIATALLAAGADIHQKDSSNRDALHHALDRIGWEEEMVAESEEAGSENVPYKVEALIRCLIEAGADINQCMPSWTRLHHAAFCRYPTAVALLLKLGADPKLDRGKLLSVASWNAREGYNHATARTIELLIAAGEDVNATDQYGYTALYCAVLDYAHTPSDEKWWNASSDGTDVTAARTLLRHGANPNAVGINGMTPLLLAAQSHLYGAACIEALLTAGADPNLPGKGGITPLMRAVNAGQLDNAHILLAHGADMRRPDNYGHDALFYAQRYLTQLETAIQTAIEAQPENENYHQWLQTKQQRAAECVAMIQSALAGSDQVENVDTLRD